jgi:two-component system chemotaxis family response regulator WspR
MSIAELDASNLDKAVMSAADAVTVLLVDDQMMVGEAIRRALADEPGVEFHYCGNPAEALAMAKAAKPTIILQDLVMPGVNGLDLVRAYREDPATARVPIIVLSTREEPTVKRDAFAVGANDYLVKLPDRIELIARIRYHSAAYLTQLQRDEAYRALAESQQKLVETNRELERLTNVDGLTGLSSRRYFNQRMEAEWKRAVRAHEPLSMLMIDVDHFKQYNDTYGHLPGDDVLKRVARAIEQGCKRSTDLAARYGGEEFAVILPITPLEDLQVVAERMCRSVEALNIPHGTSNVAPCVTVSVGGATAMPERTGSIFALVDAADKALYAAKRTGKNRVVMSGPAEPA